MSTILLCDRQHSRVIPLAASTLVGRHWACPARLADPSCPLYWLELRWLEGTWGWRALGAEERTVGTGASLPAGWRALPVATHRSGRVRLSEGTWLELLTPGPPRTYLVTLPGGELVEEEAAATWAELRPDMALPLDAEGDASRAYPDGHVIAREGVAVRVHAPGAVASTLEAALDLSRPCFLDLDLETLTASFSGGGSCVTARGECVRVLAAYLEARRMDVPRGGWLSAVEAHAAWVALGGDASAPLTRLSWERCRLRSVLSRGGAAGVGSLFEVAPGREARVRAGQTFSP